MCVSRLMGTFLIVFVFVMHWTSNASAEVVRYELYPADTECGGDQVTIPVDLGGAVSDVDSVVVTLAGRASFAQHWQTCRWGETFGCDDPELLPRYVVVKVEESDPGSRYIATDWTQTSDGLFSVNRKLSAPPGFLAGGRGQIIFQGAQFVVDFYFLCEMHDCDCGQCSPGTLIFQEPAVVDIYFQYAVATERAPFGTLKAVFR